MSQSGGNSVGEKERQGKRENCANTTTAVVMQPYDLYRAVETVSRDMQGVSMSVWRDMMEITSYDRASIMGTGLSH